MICTIDHQFCFLTYSEYQKTNYKLSNIPASSFHRWNLILKRFRRFTTFTYPFVAKPALLLCWSCCSATKSCLILRPHRLKHAKPPCPSLPLGVCSNSFPLSWQCYPTISSSVAPFSFCLQSFPPSGSFKMGQLLSSHGQSIGASASASVVPMSIQNWFALGLTGLISLLSKGPTRVFSSITVWKHQFFDTLPFLWSSSPISTWLLERP